MAEAHRARAAELQAVQSRVTKLALEAAETRRRVCTSSLVGDAGQGNGSRPFGYGRDVQYRRMLGTLQNHPSLL
eukprot:SAG31_NODE_16828_length_694_cov_0.934454_1_plen_73_part_01